MTDFYFSNPGNEFFDYGDPGTHVIEPGVSYSGLVSLSASVNAYGADSEVWLEASISFSVGDVSLSVALGGTPNDASRYYGTDADTDAVITKFSLSASEGIPITDSFELPVSTSYSLNPYSERSYFIFGISL